MFAFSPLACGPTLDGIFFLLLWQFVFKVLVTLIGLFAMWCAVGAVADQPRRKQNARRRAGLCAFCGYDLRASPRRCPECGRFADRGPAHGA